MTNHILIIWPNSANFFEQVESEVIKSGFKIIEKKEYMYAQETMRKFMFFIYDIKNKLINKKLLKQKGKIFYIYKIQQDLTNYKISNTNSGLQITIGKVFELKEKLRSHKHLADIHLTNNKPEFIKNEKGIKLFFDKSPIKNFNSIKEFLSDLEKYTPYVILRREKLNEEFIQKLLNKLEDLDLLITSRRFIQKNLKLKKIFKLHYDNKYLVEIGNNSFWVDFSYVGDGELDPKWQRSLLKNRVYIDGFWICDFQNLLFSTIYSNIFLKVNPKIEHLECLINSSKAEIIEDLGNNQLLQDCLKNFLLSNGYYVIKPFNRKYYFAYDKALDLEVYKFSLNDLMLPMRKSHFKILIKSQTSLFKYIIKKILNINLW